MRKIFLPSLPPAVERVVERSQDRVSKYESGIKANADWLSANLHLKLPAMQGRYRMVRRHIKLHRHHRSVIMLKRPNIGILAAVV